ncbi:MAG: 5-formyltetrahydrofolate cyclo-ligase [Gammaproteobacteria bacterium]|nr:5-formyltetrahydrofolate cyclo-ligase [Gammaproteobacteria bacterium]
MSDLIHRIGHASPPCSMHELTPGRHGYSVVDPQTLADVARWRRAERKRLIAKRLALSPNERRRIVDGIAVELDELIEPGPGAVISLYWPMHGELDLRDWMKSAHRKGARLALPLVVSKDQPLIFREWTPDCRMEKGVWNIPHPADGAAVLPDIVISPLVGFDQNCFRLGYGGGYFDRTLAELWPAPRAIGVGYPSARIATIFPQIHDIPMDVLVSGEGQVLYRGSSE